MRFVNYPGPSWKKLNKSELESLRLLIYPMTVTTASVSGMEKHIVKATSWRWKRFRVELSHYTFRAQSNFLPSSKNCGPFLFLLQRYFYKIWRLKRCWIQDLFQWWFVKKCAPGGRLVIVPRSLPIFLSFLVFFHPISFFFKETTFRRNFHQSQLCG